MKKLRLLLITLCVSVLMGSMAVTAYAGGGDMGYPAKLEDFVGRGGATEQSGCSPQGGRSGAEFVTTRDGLDPVEPLPTETVDPGEGFTEDGNLVTRDLLYDKATNKQFITVQTSGGNTFYIVIDYDKPTDEDGEQYQTYFLNMVDEADLLAAMQAAGGELPECACADKCAVGAINTDCTVCAVNMGECQGKAPEPAPVVEPEPEPEPEQSKNSGGTLLLVLAVVVIGGGAGWYFKIYRPKKQQAADAAEDYGDDYDDTPPWEDEEETESEGEE